MIDSDNFTILCDTVALAYHEGRNVRHLVREGLIDEECWKYLISLSNDRNDAWRQMSTTRDKARNIGSVDGVLQIFEDRFKVSLNDLAEMFANENWHHAKLYGGNAWAKIVILILELAEALRNEDIQLIQQVITDLKESRHNNGLLFDKLKKLEVSFL